MKQGLSLLVTLCAILLLSGCYMNPLGVPVYKTEQTDSSHPGYRRTTLTSGTLVYVNDYEEYSLMLINPEPKQVVGHMPFGDAKVCAIEGQETTAYLAADVGSEMPAYEVYRNIQQPPFDWRKATFQKMNFAISEGPAANKTTADQGVIQDVLSTLRDGKPTVTASFNPTDPSNRKRFCAMHLFSDALPGLIFCIGVYQDDSGYHYLAENQNARQWIKTSAVLNQWLQSH